MNRRFLQGGAAAANGGRDRMSGRRGEERRRRVRRAAGEGVGKANALRRRHAQRSDRAPLRRGAADSAARVAARQTQRE